MRSRAARWSVDAAHAVDRDLLDQQFVVDQGGVVARGVGAGRGQRDVVIGGDGRAVHARNATSWAAGGISRRAAPPLGYLTLHRGVFTLAPTQSSTGVPCPARPSPEAG